jgi:hypothetical protein
MIISNKKKQLGLIFSIFFLSCLNINFFSWAWLGAFLLVGVFFLHYNYLKSRDILSNKPFFAFFYLLSFYIISLSVFYYLFGLTKNIFNIWLLLSFLPILIESATTCQVNYFLDFKNSLTYLKNSFNEIISNHFYYLSFPLILFFLSYLYNNQITNGSPTPWINVAWWLFLLFFIFLIFFIAGVYNRKSNDIFNLTFLFLIIGLVSVKYSLPVGFDSLLHQASLNYIVSHGQIQPITPFYIGQYSLEIFIHYFTAIDFSLIERWFMASAFSVLIYVSARNFIKILFPKISYSIIPLAILFLTPQWFSYTSPYAFSLLWAILVASFLLIFLKTDNKEYFYLSVFSVITSLIIHPFVGLNLLPWILYFWFYQENRKSKNYSLLVLVFFVSSLLVVISFGLFNWLNGHNLYLSNPIVYLNNFKQIFSEPYWYVKSSAPFHLWILSAYEKISFPLVILAISTASLIRKYNLGWNIFYLLTLLLWLIFFYSKAPAFFILAAASFFVFTNIKNKSENLVLLFSLSSLLSAYLFFSVLSVDGYSNSDQVNYSSRLLQTAKWMLWPLVLSFFAIFLDKIKEQSKTFKIVIVLSLSLILTVNWYLTYPRNDYISRINVNNIRSVDYEAVDLINEMENGKEGYLVLSNQLFAAGAIQRYGFGPYYQTETMGEIFYYSVPMGGELYKRFDRLISLDNFDYNLVKKTFKDTGLKKVYFIATDYWPLDSRTEKEMKEKSVFYKNIKDKVKIYLFIDEN